MLTLNFPTSGRIGPGTQYNVAWDLVGPIVPDTQIQVEIVSNDHATVYVNTQSVTTVKTNIGNFGLIPLNGSFSGAGNGLADGSSVSIHAAMIVPGSGFVDSTYWSGFAWDAVSGLWMLTTLATARLVGGVSSSGSKIDQILSAVKKVYVNTV